MFDLKVLKTKISIFADDTLTSGMVGAEIAFQFSEEWNGLTKTAVFKAGNVQKDVLNVSGVCTIPHEVLASAGERLIVGVYGTNGNDVVIPTVYANLGRIKQGADPSGDESTEPSLPVWAQIQSDVNALENRIDGITQPTKVSQLENDAGYITAEDLPDIPSLDDYAKKQYVDDATTELKEDLDALDTRVTELEEHGGGTSDHTQLTNRDAANQHPISAITGLQTALDGKQASGDYATSGELDALADIVDGKADAADIPSLDGYATEAYVQNYHDNTKQDIITDLATIRSGAALGATALQSVPNTYALKTDIPTSLEDMGDWAAVTDVTVSSVVYHTFWKVAPTATNQVYGWAVHPTNGKLYYIYNNKGAYTATDYSAYTNSQMRTYRTATNVEVPIGAFSTGTTTSAWAEPSAGSYKAAYGVVCNDTSKRVTMNPSTGKITFNGEVGGAGFEAAVNALIDAKLGVIENGSY